MAADALTTAWQNAEKSGDYSQIAGLLGNMSGDQLMSTYGLNANDLAYINNMAGTNLASAPAQTQADPLADAWRNAESSGDYGSIAGLLNGKTGADLMSVYGLKDNDLAYINSKAGTKLFAPTGDTLADAWKTAEANGDYSKIAELLGNKTGQELMSLYGLNANDLAYINNKAGVNLQNGAVPTLQKPVVQKPVVPQVKGPLPAGAAAAQLQQAGQPTASTPAPAAPGGGWSERRTVGGSDGAMLGAGNANYHSSLIKSLRQASLTPYSNNEGVQLVPNVGTTDVNWTAPTGASAFSPKVLGPRLASPQEISDWDAYNAYKMASVGALKPFLSLQDWIANGRNSDATKAAAAPTEPAQNWSGY